jgi:hypothetical protein
MFKNGFRCSMALYKEDGKSLVEVPIDPDFQPAEEWTRFSGVRQGIIAPNDLGRASIKPIWHPKAGQPYLGGFRVSVSGLNSVGRRRRLCVGFPIAYFEPVAQRIASVCVDKNLLKSGERFFYSLSAFPCEGQHCEQPSGVFHVEEVAPPLPLRQSRLDDFVRDSSPFGQGNVQDFPVFVPQGVLDEAAALTAQAGANETGGVLVGHLHRDSGVPEVFAEVTAQIPASHTRSGVTKLTFTAETWTAVQAAINLRRRSEVMLGWWHSHTYMKETCKNCEKAKDKTCSATALFMSDVDCAFHRTVFPRAYSVAVVVSDNPCTGMSWALFGWRGGMIVARGCHILSKQRRDALAEVPTPGGNNNAAAT